VWRYANDDQEARWSYKAEKRPAPWALLVKSPADRVNFSLGDFELLSMSDQEDYWITTDWFVRLPLWLFLPFAIPPILWLRRRSRRAIRGFPVEMIASTEMRGSHGSTCLPQADTKATKKATKG